MKNSMGNPIARCMFGLTALILLVPCGAETVGDRRAEFLRLSAEADRGNPYTEACRMAAGLPARASAIDPALESVGRRVDCSDFRMHGLLRILYQFGDSTLLAPDLKRRIEEAVLNFKYWPDEPGIDSMCTWSENHYILFSSAGYLAGQLFPDATFENAGDMGRDKMRVHRPRIEKWLELRFKTGFSEWLSNVYYDEDLTALFNLVDFCEDEAIASRAREVIDLILADITLNSFQGIFGATHGRSYKGNKMYARNEATRTFAKIAFGRGYYSAGNMSGSLLALSDYKVPARLIAIANDDTRPMMINRQRMGIRICEAERWGLDPKRFEDGMHFLTLEAYFHPRIAPLTMELFDEYNWWENEFFADANKDQLNTLRRFGLLRAFCWFYRKDVTRNTREEVNIYTCRSPDYMLSTAQDYRNGYGGDQQSIWQATLGPDAVVFTTHPALGKQPTPDDWTGSGYLPRAAQHENIAIIVYDATERRGIYVTETATYTHAWFPRHTFDEVVEANGWVCARKGNGYLAFYSQNPYTWHEDENGNLSELRVAGRRNVYICELGRADTDGSFTEFVQRIKSVRPEFRHLEVRYDSPSKGRVRFGWHGPFRINGKSISLRDYPRYENPYFNAPFPLNKPPDLLGDEPVALLHTGKNSQ